MNDNRMERRQFIKLTGKAAALASVFGGGSYILSQNIYSPKHQAAAIYKGDRSPDIDTDFPDLISLRSKDHAAAALEAIGLLGGISRFIARGDIVTIKPNIGWDRSPAQGANTNPDLVRAVALACLDAGAAKVMVTDVPCNDSRRTFRRSGIDDALKGTGVEVLLPEEHLFVNADLGGEILGEWPVLKPFLENDKLINMPIIKQHGLSKITAGMKNWYGVLGGPRNRLHQEINRSIADLADYFRPTLIIADATRVLTRNGPAGGSQTDVETHDIVIASANQVAVDSYACRFLNLDPQTIEYIKQGEARGLGRIDGYSVQERI